MHEFKEKLFSTGASVGIFSAPLNQMAGNIHDSSYPDDFMNGLTWIDLSTAETMVIFYFSVSIHYLLLFSFLLCICFKLGAT